MLYDDEFYCCDVCGAECTEDEMVLEMGMCEGCYDNMYAD